MIALSVSIAAVSAVQLAAPEAASPAAPGVALQASVVPGEREVNLVHAGGLPLDAGRLTAQVWVNDELIHRAPAADPGTIWASGDPLPLALPSSLAPGARAQVVLLDEVTGEMVASVEMRAPLTSGVTGAPPGFALQASLAGGTGPLELVAGGTFRIDATVLHPEGRKFLRYVYLDLSALGGGTWIDLTDDGTGGDLVPSDGIYGGLAVVPTDAPSTGTLRVVAVDIAGAMVELELHVGIGLPPLPPPPAPQAPAPVPCFRIRPDGGVEPLAHAALSTKVVGVDITYGRDGPRIPVVASFTPDGGRTVTPLYGGVPVARGMNESFMAAPGHILGIRGQADYASFHSTRSSWISQPQVKVLKDGDLPPDVPAFGTIQQDIAVYLAPYVTDGRMDLEYDEAIVLVEFVNDLTSAAADFQDLVILFDFECPPDLASAPTPTLAPAPAPTPAPILIPGTTDVPCRSIPGGSAWDQLRVEPVRDGTYTMGTFSVTLSAVTSTTFDWSASAGVDAIVVKGALGGSNLYRYDPEGTAGRGLASPGIASNTMASVTFCFD